MANRPAKPANMPWMLPALTVKDADAAVAFYQKAFGFDKRFSMPGPDGRTMHAEVSWHDGVIMLGPENENGSGFLSDIGFFKSSINAAISSLDLSTAGLTASVFTEAAPCFWLEASLFSSTCAQAFRMLIISSALSFPFKESFSIMRAKSSSVTFSNLTA